MWYTLEHRISLNNTTEKENDMKIYNEGKQYRENTHKAQVSV